MIAKTTSGQGIKTRRLSFTKKWGMISLTIPHSTTVQCGSDGGAPESFLAKHEIDSEKKCVSFGFFLWFFLVFSIPQTTQPPAKWPGVAS
jgi:hypothetical protein